MKTFVPQLPLRKRSGREVFKRFEYFYIEGMGKITNVIHPTNQFGVDQIVLRMESDRQFLEHARAEGVDIPELSDLIEPSVEGGAE